MFYSQTSTNDYGSTNNYTGLICKLSNPLMLCAPSLSVTAQSIHQNAVPGFSLEQETLEVNISSYVLLC